MDLLYFKSLKMAAKNKDHELYRRVSKCKPHCIPTELIDPSRIEERMEDPAFVDNLRKLASMIPVENMWVEFFSRFRLKNGMELDFFLCEEMEPNLYKLLTYGPGGVVVIYIQPMEEKIFVYDQLAQDGVSASLSEYKQDTFQPGEDLFNAALWVGTVFLLFIEAMTKKENQVGTARVSKLIRGQVRSSEVVYVRRKNIVYPMTNKTPHHVEWHHSWRVSGCWVRIRGVGKDRSGNRTVKGLTWRVPHVKGKGPLKEKIRVMLPEKGLQNSDNPDNGV